MLLETIWHSQPLYIIVVSERRIDEHKVGEW